MEKPCGDDPDEAQGAIFLTTGFGAGSMTKPKTPFAISCFSNDLHFWVRGEYWVEQPPIPTPLAVPPQ